MAEDQRGKPEKIGKPQNQAQQRKSQGPEAAGAILAVQVPPLGQAAKQVGPEKGNRAFSRKYPLLLGESDPGRLWPGSSRGSPMRNRRLGS